jgi:hypothetical protein
MMQPDRLAAALADRYRIERELGQEGMATVYLAQDVKHDRKVASTQQAIYHRAQQGELFREEPELRTLVARHGTGPAPDVAVQSNESR